MKKQRRYFSLEFKAGAVKLVTERGYSVAQACRELSIGELLFAVGWRKSKPKRKAMC